MAAFELCFSIRKEFLKKKVSGENTFDLISVFHVQIQQPKRRSTTTTDYHKIFETSLWPLHYWRYKDLSMSRDQKVIALLPPIEKCPID